MADKFRKAGSNLRKGVKSMIKESREIINNLKKKTSQEKGEDKSKDPENTDYISDDSSSDEIEDIGAIAANLMSETKKLTQELRKLEQEYDKQTEDKRRIKKEKEEVEEKYKVISKAFIDAVRIIDEFATGQRKSGSEHLLDFNEDMSKACIFLMKSVYDQRDNELMSNCILKYCTEVATSPRASVQLSGENGRPKSTEVKSPAKIASPRATVTFADSVVPKEEPVEVVNHEELIVSIFQGLQNENMSPRNSANVTPVKTTSAVTSSTSTPTTKNETKVSTPDVSSVKSDTKTSPRTHAQSTNDAVKPTTATASPKPTVDHSGELTKKPSWTNTRPKSVAIESSVVNASILSNKRMSGAVDMNAGTLSSPLHPTTATLSTPTHTPKPYSAPTSPNQPSTTTTNNTVSSSLPTSPAGPANVKTTVQTANAKSRANPTPPPSSVNAKREPPRLSQVIPNYRPPKKTPTTNPPTASSPSHATTGQPATNSPSHPSALDKLLSPLTSGQPSSPTQNISTTSSTSATNTPPPKLNIGSNGSTPTNKSSAVQSFVANIEKTSPRATGPTSPRNSVTGATSPRNSVPSTPTNKTSATTTPVTSPTNKTTAPTTSTASPSVAQTSTWTKSPAKTPSDPVKKVESPVVPEKPKPKVEEKPISPRKESSSNNTPTKTSENTNTNNVPDPNAKPVITDESDAEDLIKFILRSV
eukprot:TRINITY_DN672_c0_g1_i1.p1 TRINITY_DN672_c0_g1~~TRINITY_DN672_c0_g1_i1.p1  ORF type:complete len:702 (+),score=123.09 TRINITY_DN672_c0_g1_i1:88-2193(+)